jgi:hypothetical protein
MHQRPRRPEEREPRTSERRPPPQPAPADALLELQRGAGNHAVSNMLARETKDKPKSEATGTRALLPAVGTISLQSVQFSGSRPGVARGKKGEEEESKSGDVAVTSKAGDHSTALIRASFDGKAMDVELILAGSGGNLRFRLKNATINDYAVSEDNEVWTISYASIEQDDHGSGTSVPE